MAIKTRLALLFICFVLLVTSVIGVLTYLSSKSLLEQNVLTRSQYYFATFAERLTNETDGDRRNALILSQVPYTKVLLDKGGSEIDRSALVGRAEDDLADLFHLYLTQYEAYDQIRLIDVNGQERVRLQKNDKKIERIVGVDLQNKSQRDYFQHTIALHRHQMYTSEMNLNRERGVLEIPYRPVIRYGAPVFNQEGQTIGVIVINVNAKYMLSDIVYPRGHVFLVNESGYFLKHHDKKMEYGFDLGNDFTIRNIHPGLFPKMEKNDELIQVQNEIHKEFNDGYILGFKKVYYDTQNKDRYWNLVFEIPASFTFKSINDLGYKYGWISILVIFSGSWVAFFVARSLSRPIAVLNTVAQEVANGGFDVEIDVNGGRKDEIGELSRSLAMMVVNLKNIDAQNTRRIWFESGQVSLSECMRGITSVKDLSNKIVSNVAQHLGAQCGILYVVDDDGVAKAEGAYAQSANLDLNMSFNVGIGMVGQVMLDRKMVVIEDISSNNLKIESGLFEGVEATVLFMPFVLAGGVKAVVELAKLTPFEDIHKEYLEVVAESIVVSLSHAQGGERLERAYDRQTEMTEVLAAQQEELRQSNEELQSINEELEEGRHALEDQRRTLIVKNSEVEQQAIDLKAASQYKSEFLANMSHELRTPLNSLLILSRMLFENEEENLTEQQVEYAQTIFDSGSDLLHLIDDILDLSKVEAGHLKVYCESIEIETVVERLRNLFNPLAASKSIKLDFKYDGSPRSIVTDSGRLEQILRNLLSNAIKFTESGSVTLGIKASAGQTVTFEVLDTGIGMPQECQDEIFMPFKQLDSGISRRYAGTGLGLSIVQELTRLLGGSISVESVVSQGSIFKVVFPLLLSVNCEKQPQVARRIENPVKSIKDSDDNRSVLDKEIIGQRDEVKEGDLSVLVIDEDSVFVEKLFAVAEHLGYKYVASRNGAVGIHLAQILIPSAIIVNASLRGLDGSEVIAQLKGDLRTRHIPIFTYDEKNKYNGSNIIAGIAGIIRKSDTKDEIVLELEKIEDLISKKVRTILVVEDDIAQLMSIRKMLSTEHLEVLAVGSGQEACDLLQGHEIDCIVLDMGLKGELGGMDVLRKVRDETSLRRIPIIIYTNWDLSKNQESELLDLADSVIRKDISSHNRLFDEVTLFLHQVVNLMSESQRKILEALYDQECGLEGRRILLVDDDMRNIYAMSSVLEKNGLQVSIANNGIEAIDLAMNDKGYDLIFMDIMMPKMDGYEAIKCIRKIIGYEDVPIIALTAKTMNEDREECLESGASDYLSKPINKDILLSLLRVWLYQRAQP